MRSSVLIVNWRTSALLRRLLESLGQFPPAGEHEVIVVDNASDDFELARFERDFPSVKFLPQTRNLGFARGNNLALEHSTGEHILLLNPDTEVTDGALETLVAEVVAMMNAGETLDTIIHNKGGIWLSHGIVAPQPQPPIPPTCATHRGSTLRPGVAPSAVAASPANSRAVSGGFAVGRCQTWP